MSNQNNNSLGKAFNIVGFNVANRSVRVELDEQMMGELAKAILSPSKPINPAVCSLAMMLGDMAKIRNGVCELDDCPYLAKVDKALREEYEDGGLFYSGDDDDVTSAPEVFTGEEAGIR